MLSSGGVSAQFLQPKLRIKQSLQDCEVTNSQSTILAWLLVVDGLGIHRNTISNIIGKEIEIVRFAWL